jgi:hypothetical protein
MTAEIFERIFNPDFDKTEKSGLCMAAFPV